MSKQKVKIYNEELGQGSEVLASALGVWERHGWTRVDDEDSSEQSDPDGDLVKVEEPVQVQPPTDAPPATPQGAKKAAAPGAPGTDKKE